jgi:hypothetical protein
MLLLTLSFILLTVTVSYALSTEDSWTTKAPMQQARAGLGVAVVNEKIYAIGGQPGSSRSSIDINEEYDPATNTWVFKEPMPTARTGFAIATYNNKIYCIGGRKLIVTYENHVWVSSESFVLDVNEVYDPATDTWETKTPIPTAKHAIKANVVCDKIYVVGDQSDELWIYDPASDSWSTKTPMPVALSLVGGGWSCASVVVDNKLHVIGAFPLSNCHQIYDPETDSWSFGPPVIAGYNFAFAGATTGEYAPKRIYVYGTNSQYWDLGLPDFFGQSYDPTTGNWTVGTSMPTERIRVGVAVVNDTLYVIGGYTLIIGNNVFASDVNEEYTPIDYIPEFPSWIIMLLLIVGTLVIMICKERLPKIPSN